MSFLDDFNSWVSDAAKQFGVSQSYLQTTARIESGLNPTAAGGGLFQFRGGAMTDVGLSNALDPRASTFGAAQYAAINTASLTRALGRAPADWEVYLAHQQGAGGAAKILTNPGAYASDVVSNFAGNVNASEFKKITGLDINNPLRPITAGDFADYWKKKYQATSGAADPAFSIPALGGGSSQTTTAAAAAGLSAEVGATAASTEQDVFARWSSWLEHSLIRGAVIVTGFLFLGAGLGLFALSAVFSTNAGSIIGGSAIGGAVAGRMARQKPSQEMASAPPPEPPVTPLTKVEPPAPALPPPVVDASFEDLTPPPPYTALADDTRSAERARFDLLSETNKGFREFVKDKPQESDADLATLHRGFFPGAKEYVREEQSAAAKRLKDEPVQSSLIAAPGSAAEAPSFWENVSAGLSDTALTSAGRKKIASGWNAYVRENTPKKIKASKAKVTPLTEAERSAISTPPETATDGGFKVGQQVRLRDPQGKGRTSETFTITEIFNDPKHGQGAKVEGTHSGTGYFPVGELEYVPQALRPIRARVRNQLLKLGVLRDFTKPGPKKK